MATAVDRGQIEEARLTALLGYGILDTSPEEAFDDLVELAAALCDAPVASIAFVDGTRSWFKAKHGVELSEVPRDVAFSAEVLRHDDLLVVPDARADDRFRSSEFLARGFRFFAGMPLLSPDGYALGALCILDRPPRDLSPTQRDGLQAIARRVMHELEIRRVAHIQVRTGDGFRPLVEQLLGALYIEDLGASTGWYFSPQIEPLTGYTPAEWASEPDFFGRVLHPEDRDWVLADTARAHETGEPIRLEYRIIAKDGRIVWLQDDAAVARDADGGPRYFQGLLTDITARRELTAERDSLLGQKDELLAMVSHELRTPLTSILGYLDLVHEDGGLTEQQSDFLRVIDNNARRLLTLVSDLLFVADAQARPVALERTAVDVADVVEQAAVAARPAAVSRGVELTLHPGARPVVSGDVHRLGQVVDNLLSNAVKFTPAGGSIDVRVLTEDERVVIEVADTGMGMSAADQEALFVRFFRTESARRKAIHGTGLGLSIVKAIVEAHGGEITVESAEGRGTTFRVFLPKAPRA